VEFVSIILGALVLVDETGYFGGVQKLDFRIFLRLMMVVRRDRLLFGSPRIAAKRCARPRRTSGWNDARRASTTAAAESDGWGYGLLSDGARWKHGGRVIEPGQEVVVEEVMSNPTPQGEANREKAHLMQAFGGSLGHVRRGPRFVLTPVWEVHSHRQGVRALCRLPTRPRRS